MAFKRKEYHKEENCLNCGFPLVGKFCGNCGQKAFLHKDSFLHMAGHFAADYFHYDGKFWKTLKTLFTKPGLATVEYNEGKRARYLNPIQLYIFVTTVFFLIAFSSSHSENKQVNTEKRRIADSLSSVANLKDSMEVNGVELNDNGEVNFNFSLPETEIENVQQYDSIQNLLPDSMKDESVTRYLNRKKLSYGNNEKFNDKLVENLTHNIPKLFFLLLPYFALLLLAVNFRKKMYYIDHIIFSLHVHSVLFILLILGTLLNLLIPYDSFETFVYIAIFFIMLVYIFLSLRRVYHGGFFKVFIKQLFLSFGYFIGLILATVILFFLTIIMM